MLNLKATFLALPLLTSVAVVAQAATVALAPLHPASASAQIVDAAAACRNPATPARVTAAFVEYPMLAELRGDSGTAGVGITLFATGRLQRAWLVRSSGNAVLDLGAMEAARMSGYAAQRENCNSVGGSYLLEVEFAK